MSFSVLPENHLKKKLGKSILSDQELESIIGTLDRRKGDVGLVEPPEGRMLHPMETVSQSRSEGNPWLAAVESKLTRYENGQAKEGSYLEITSAANADAAEQGIVQSSHSVSTVPITLRDPQSIDPDASFREFLGSVYTYVLPVHNFPPVNETTGKKGLWTWQYPGGGTGNLSATEAANKELAEESGMAAAITELASEHIVARGLSSETMYTVMAYGLRTATDYEAKEQDDGDVTAEGYWVTFDQFEELSYLGVIADTQTIASYHAARTWLRDPENRDRLLDVELTAQEV